MNKCGQTHNVFGFPLPYSEQRGYCDWEKQFHEDPVNYHYECGSRPEQCTGHVFIPLDDFRVLVQEVINENKQKNTHDRRKQAQ